MNQRGFATLEVILMVMVIGILASIAVPRFTTVTAAANTAKIQADLSAIDTAIAIYRMEKGQDPTSITDLKDYLQDEVTPPSGSAYINGDETAISATAYAFKDVEKGTGDNKVTEKRAALDSHTAGEFKMKGNTSQGTTTANNETNG